MADNFQLIHFPAPEYLVSYFSSLVKSEIQIINGIKTIEINRSSDIGKIIITSIDKQSKKIKHTNLDDYYLKISNFIGNNYSGSVRGDRHFLFIEESKMNNIMEMIKHHFDYSLINFVDGAEYAHRKNGWEENQKRKGIRKAAIQTFLQKNNVNLGNKSLENFFKMFQRHKNNANNKNSMLLEKYVQTLSF
ncbi:hypothetical protein [Abyssalbus ytuae]|uniref:Uncharacterized protein n=1 Tax=Abyssalbus ytuae TaxID=2926907 RepID=A0A9E6ZTU4_9FLAO|nr:hypothetical protein [Abyssalbus ytuae]UOB16591.1 hypothetical protein MQE35_12700 [Abyssalbus ytuae]